MYPPGNMLFGVPKKGRLFDACNKLLHGIGLEYDRPNRLDIATCKNLPITLVFLPASDIAMFVGEGKVTLGITGEDMVAEAGVNVKVVRQLGFGKCTLSIQTPVTNKVTDYRSLSGKRIATSFPRLTKEFFDKIDNPGNPTQIRFLSGSVEASCGLGLADAVVDLVETGTTMKAAGLEKIADVMATQTVLIEKVQSDEHADLVKTLLMRVNGYFMAKAYQMIQYNVEGSNLEAAKKITPGKKSPNVMELSEANWFSVSAMILKKDSASKMDDLIACGACDILLFDIANCRA